MSSPADLKSLLRPLRRAMADFEAGSVQQALFGLFHPDAQVRLTHPFEDLLGAEALYAQAYAPLLAAWPDLERRDHIVLAGRDGAGSDWVGCCGFYTGTFMEPWMHIPPTGHQVAIRFHEFYRVSEGRVAEMQALWDLPEVMMQAGVWPMAPSLGREWQVPGPLTQDGLCDRLGDEATSAASLRLVQEMLAGLSRHATGGVAAMQLDRYWHPRCNWYGPSGIGTARGVSGFRQWHQIPFLRALPDRAGSSATGSGHLFAEGDYVAVTGWPNMKATITGDGWMGIAPAGQKITLRSLDFWRCEQGLIRENWVLVDLLHLYRQIGVDVMLRMRELSGARQRGAYPYASKV